MCPQISGGEGIIGEDLDEGESGSLLELRWDMVEELID